MNETNKLKQSQVDLNKNNKRKEDKGEEEDVLSQASECRDSEMESDPERHKTCGGDSRRSSVSSGTGYTWTDIKEKKATQKKRKLEERTELNTGKNCDIRDDNQDVIDYVSNQRKELEKFLFMENNKVTRPAIKFILEKWRNLETKMTEMIVKQSNLAGRLEEVTKYNVKNRCCERTFAEAASSKTKSKNEDQNN